MTGDPFDGPNVSRLVRSGGNPSLNAETVNVVQAGLTWAPKHGTLVGLALEVNWFRYDLENLITGVGPAYVLDNELGGLGHLVLRDPGTETYVNNTGSTGQPYWRGRGVLVWELGAWNASATLQYTPGSGDLLIEGSHFKPYRVLHLQAGYRTGRDSWLRGAVITVGIDDLFNEEPPLVNDPPIGYSYANVSRPQGRFWRASMKQEW